MTLVIRADRLGKRYRIGKLRAREPGRLLIARTLTAPFHYLSSTLRLPSEEEILWALRDVTFEVAQGEVVGIIGRNGAGKSTLLKVLSRITEPTTGRAILHGRVGSLLEVGTGFHPELTGRENIYLSGTILGMKRFEIDRKLDEIVAFAEVEQFLDTQVKRYSSGMYVRLGFAVAAHLEPEILLIDEVLAVGDAAFQKKCLGKMGDVATEGRTVLFVSHNLVAIQNLCDRSLWFDNGELRLDGKSQKVISSYLNEYHANKSERIWNEKETAPGNDKIRIHSVRISSEKQSPDEGFTMETPVEIEVQFWNEIPGTSLLVGWRLFTEHQVAAFTTISNETISGFSGNQLDQGLFRYICHLPANLLNEGGYHISLIFYRDRGLIMFRLDDALSFDIINSGIRPGYRYSREPGAVRPLLKWDREKIAEG